MEQNPYQSPVESEAIADSHAAAIRNGRIAVIVVISFFVGCSLLTIVFFNLFSGSQRLPTQIVRLILTGALAACIYAGYDWARYVTAALLGMAVLFTLITLPAVINYPIALAGLVLMVAGYSACFVTLVFVPSVGVFMKHQRGKAPAKPKWTMDSAPESAQDLEQCPWCEEMVVPVDGACPACNRPL